MGEKSIKEFYGEGVQKTSDLSYNPCCPINVGSRFKDFDPLVPIEIKEGNYGCGSPFPLYDLTSLRAADFGCGRGEDVYRLSHLVGSLGFVYGIDFTDKSK